MIVVVLKNTQRAEVAAGATVDAATFPSEPGANPAPALAVKDPSGVVVGMFRASEVAYYQIVSANA